MFPSPFGADAGLGSYMGFGYPYYSWDPNYYGNYGYYYSPFGYAYSGLYGLPYYYPGSVIVGGDTDTPSQTDTGEGRVVNGLGYTRIRPREAVGTETSGGDASESSSSRGGRSTVSSGGYSQSGGSSDSGGGSSSAGSSSSGSGGSGGGRTAQPR
jgi:hypothetical protein